MQEELTIDWRLVFKDARNPTEFDNFSFAGIADDASADDITVWTLSAAFDGNYEPLPGGAAGEQIYAGQIRIPAGSEFFGPITIAAAFDDSVELAEVFYAEIVDAHGAYVLPATQIAIAAPVEGAPPFREGGAAMPLYILDGLTAFAAENSRVSLRDYSNAAELASSTGIHPNDVRQGNLGDCYFMAVVLGLAKAPGAIQRLIHETDDGFAVALYEYKETIGGEAIYDWKWKEYTARDLLQEGDFGAYLSLDRNGEGKYEIWPQLLQRRFRDSDYFRYPHLHPGNESAIFALTGQAPGIIDLELESAAIVDSIADHLGGGDMVYFATLSQFAGGQRSSQVNANQDDNIIYANHVYSIDGAGPSGLNLANPWGEQHVKPLPTDKLKAHAALIYYIPADYGLGPIWED